MDGFGFSEEWRRRFRAGLWALVALGFLCSFMVPISAEAQRQLKPRRITVGARSMPAIKPSVRKIDLRRQQRRRAWRRGDGIKYIPKRFYVSPKVETYLKEVKPPPRVEDPLMGIQRNYPQRRAFTSPDFNIEGLAFSGATPPDTILDVGNNYVIQATNTSGGSAFNVYDKSDGSLVAGPLSMQSLATSGSDCATGAGDPIILFDEMAGRWMLSEFSDFGNKLCVYVAITSNPISGGWYAYEFQASEFPDYPKFGVWSDGYYIGTNESSGPALYVIDRSSMLVGASASMQTFSVSSLAAFGFQMVTPADHDGTLAPPVGSPGLFVRHRDDEAHNSSSSNASEDYLEIFELSVDWTNPALSQLSGPVLLPMSEFDSHLCGFTSFSCIDQPGGGPGLDPLREVSMWRVQYRNMGTYESLVGSHVTDTSGNDEAGIRWWEARKAGAGNWALHQEGTYSPDSLNRWMSSAAMDRAGNLALGYSVSSTSVYPGLRYTGRLSSDPAGVMSQGETTIVSGTGSHSSERWGDYSSLNVDPVDGCTFWYTSEYGKAGGNWATKLASFSFDGCEGGSISLAGSPLTQTVCVPPASLDPIALDVTGLGGFSGDVTLSLADLPSGFSGTFSTNPVVSGNSANLQLSTDGTTQAGSQTLNIVAEGQDVNAATITASIDVYTTDLSGEAPPLISPADTSTSSSSSPTLTWDPVAQATSYTLEIDDDATFASIDYTWTGSATTHEVSTALASSTTHFWRVRATNPCGSETSAAWSFDVVTPTLFCESPSLSIDTGVNSAVSDLAISDPGTIEDLKLQLNVTHSWVGDLGVVLTHVDTGTSVNMIDRPGVPALGTLGCENDDIDITLSDDAASFAEDECSSSSPAISGELKPSAALGTFDGESITGTWRVSVSDYEGGDDGELVSWCLEPTFVPEPGAGAMLLVGVLSLLAERKRRCRRLS